MNPEQNTNSVKTARTDRTAGDAPNIGKVLKMPGTGLPKGEKRKRKKGERSRKLGNRIISNWMILVSLLMALVVGFFIYSLVRLSKNKTEGTTSQRLVIDNTELKVSEDAGPKSPTEDEALGLVKSALAVREPTQVASYFEMGNHTADAVVAFLRDMEKTDGSITETSWLSNMNANGLILEGVVVHFSKDDQKRNRIAFLRPHGKTDWKLDFESFARIQSPSLQEMLSKQVERARVRVFLAIDSYYNGPFSDDQKWTCYAISSPDVTEVLQAYCRTGSPQAAAIESIVSKGQKTNRVILEVQRVSEGLANQVEMTRVLAEDWVMGPEPFDQRFD